MESEHEEIKKDKYEIVSEDESKRGLIAGCLFPLAAAAIIGALLYSFLTPRVITFRQQVVSRQCLRCHAEMFPFFKKKKTHSPFVKKACAACHTSHGLELVKKIKVASSATAAKKKPARVYLTRFKAPKPKKKSRLLYSRAKLCADKCHKATANEVNQKYSMLPFTAKQCLSCHSPHASDNDHLTRAPMQILCLTCHPKIAKYYAKPTLHPPFKVGSCTSCHKAHASNFKPLLRRPPKILCFVCHPKIAKFKQKPVKMEPFAQGKCPRCHNPHGSVNAKLLQAPLPTLCFSCHEKIGKLQKKAVMMKPFRQGRCLECHWPHASDYSKLLRDSLKGNNICYRCHSQIRPNYLGIGHNRIVRNASPYQPEAGVGSCLNCHEPHASNFSGLIQKEQISLCLSCHGPRRYFAHPIGFKWDDPWRGGYLRCSSCHNPMGSGIQRLKRAERDGLCLSCHMASDPSFIFFSTGKKKWHSYQIPDST